MTPSALILYAGLEGSRTLGESSPSLLIQAAHVSRHVQARAFFSDADKVESGSGYILGTDADWLILDGGFTPTLGIGYHYRDGGAWTKRSVLARAGVAYRDAALTAAVDMTTANRVREVELTARIWIGRLSVEPRVMLVSYIQAGKRETGLPTSVSLGIDVR